MNNSRRKRVLILFILDIIALFMYVIISHYIVKDILISLDVSFLIVVAIQILFLYLLKNNEEFDYNFILSNLIILGFNK